MGAFLRDVFLSVVSAGRDLDAGRRLAEGGGGGRNYLLPDARHVGRGDLRQCQAADSHGRFFDGDCGIVRLRSAVALRTATGRRVAVRAGNGGGRRSDRISGGVARSHRSQFRGPAAERASAGGTFIRRRLAGSRAVHPRGCLPGKIELRHVYFARAAAVVVLPVDAPLLRAAVYRSGNRDFGGSLPLHRGAGQPVPARAGGAG